MANPEQQGLKLQIRELAICSVFALMANPEQQGLKHGFSVVEANNVLALMANPEQQGLKHILLNPLDFFRGAP